MKRLSPMLRQALVFVSVFLSLGFLLELTVKMLLEALGWSPLPRLQFMAENEIGLQILSILGALAVLFAIERMVGTSDSRPALSVAPYIAFERAMNFLFLGFLVAALVVGISTLIGFTQIEAPSVNLSRLLWLLPWLVFQAFYFLLWLLVVEILRRGFFHRVTSGQMDQLPAVLLAVMFESHLLYSIAEGHGVASHSGEALLFCVLISLTLNLTCLLSFRTESLRGESFVPRFFFLGGLGVSFLNIFGQNVATWRAASVLQLYTGPLGVAPIYFYIVLILIVANTAFQKLLRANSPQA